jgi:surface antigen
MTITQVAFEKKYLGKKVGSGQCVPLARQYLVEVKGLPAGVVPYGSDAKEWWANAPSSRFRKITGGVPYEGSIVILSTGEHGHVFIARKGATAETVPALEANWAQKLKVTFGRHRNKNLRWLYPRQ